MLRQASSVRSLRTSARTAPGICDAVSKRFFPADGRAARGMAIGRGKRPTNSLQQSQGKEQDRVPSFVSGHGCGGWSLGTDFDRDGTMGVRRRSWLGGRRRSSGTSREIVARPGLFEKAWQNRHCVLPIDGAADGKQKMSTGVDRGEKAGRELQRPRASSAQKAVRDAFNSANVGPST